VILSKGRPITLMTEQTGTQLRDQGMEQSAASEENAKARAVAEQALEVLIKTTPEFTASNVIEACTELGVEAKDWRCIGSMFAKAARDGRIRAIGLENSRRKSRHAGDQKIWESLEYQLWD